MSQNDLNLLAILSIVIIETNKQINKYFINDVKDILYELEFWNYL
jgi:hypothetical protein